MELTILTILAGLRAMADMEICQNTFLEPMVTSILQEMEYTNSFCTLMTGQWCSLVLLRDPNLIRLVNFIHCLSQAF